MSKHTILSAIREKCTECSGDSIGEVRKCPVVSCALHRYRMGKDPDRSGRCLTPEERIAFSERMRKAREDK